MEVAMQQEALQQVIVVPQIGSRAKGRIARELVALPQLTAG